MRQDTKQYKNLKKRLNTQYIDNMYKFSLDYCNSCKYKNNSKCSHNGLYKDFGILDERCINFKNYKINKALDKL
jgi:hypothetical protein